MIALYEAGQWERKTLRQLKTQFPDVSFRKSSEQDGATWTYRGVEYAAVLVIEVASPLPVDGERVTPGPLEDFEGAPRQAWVVTPAPVRGPSDFFLAAYQFHTMLEDIGKDQQIRQAIAAAYSGTAYRLAMNKLERGALFLRDDPLVVGLAVVVGLTPEDVDTLWLQATGY